MLELFLLIPFFTLNVVMTLGLIYLTAFIERMIRSRAMRNMLTGLCEGLFFMAMLYGAAFIYCLVP